MNEESNKMNTTLCLFTIDFPYSNGEPFLENEITILSNHFSKIYIFPSRKTSDQARVLPHNVEVVDILTKTTPFGISQLIKHSHTILPIYIWTLLHTSFKKNYLRYFKSLLDYLYQDIRKHNQLKSFIIDNRLNGVVFYDYWSLNTTTTLALLRKNGIIKKAICRAHGFDLYEDRYMEGIIPFREFKYRYFDSVFVVSNHGRSNIQKAISGKDHSKIKVSYLGVSLPESKPINRNPTDQFIILTCANLIPLKRMSLMPDVLAQIPTHLKTKWIHIGDGQEKESILSKTSILSNHITVELKGNMTNQEVIQFYAQNYFDLFMNISSTEGLPVSMMEAQSYGIPILACSINGIPEIVNEDTGVLIPKNSDINQIANALLKTMKMQFDRSKIINHFSSHFDRTKNYNHFVSLLK